MKKIHIAIAILMFLCAACAKPNNVIGLEQEPEFSPSSAITLVDSVSEIDTISPPIIEPVDSIPDPIIDPDTLPIIEPSISKLDIEALQSFFNNTLAGTTAPIYEVSTPIAFEAISTYQDSVWNLWKEANNLLTSNKLIGLQTLSTSREGTLQMPLGLETASNMHYYFGNLGTKPEAGYPLYIYLHGSGEISGEWSEAYNWCTMWQGVSPSNAGIYFVPRIPNDNLDTEHNKWYQQGKQYLFEQTIRQVMLMPEANPHRLFVLGFSEGAYGSQRLASFYADYWAGACPMAGGEPLINAPAENCANIYFGLTTGSLDVAYGRKALTEIAKEEFAKLQSNISNPSANKYYYSHKITIQDGSDLWPPKVGLDHGEIDKTVVFYTVNKYAADRSASPNYVYWENFPMDGQYRKGFYNLQPLEPSTTNPNERTCYEEKIEGQTITLNVQNVTYTALSDNYNGITLRYDKTYTPATTGKLRIYLSPESIALDQAIKVIVNGREVFNGLPSIDGKYMVQSCALFFDPLRVFPAAIDIEI